MKPTKRPPPPKPEVMLTGEFGFAELLALIILIALVITNLCLYLGIVITWLLHS
jgi:hypothetical protein